MYDVVEFLDDASSNSNSTLNFGWGEHKHTRRRRLDDDGGAFSHNQVFVQSPEFCEKRKRAKATVCFSVLILREDGMKELGVAIDFS